MFNLYAAAVSGHAWVSSTITPIRLTCSDESVEPAILGTVATDLGKATLSDETVEKRHLVSKGLR